MPQRHRAIDEASRYCLVIGAILFLIANLVPLAGAKTVVLVFGSIFAIAGMLGMVVAVFVGKNKGRSSKNQANSTDHSHTDHSSRSAHSHNSHQNKKSGRQSARRR